RPLPLILGAQISERTDAAIHWNRRVARPQMLSVQLQPPPFLQYNPPRFRFYETPTARAVGTANARTIAQGSSELRSQRGLHGLRLASSIANVPRRLVVATRSGV